MKNKLLNFTICQALIIIGMSLLCVKCQEQKLSASENVTVYDRSFHRVLSRRKRFLLWRPGSNVLVRYMYIFRVLSVCMCLHNPMILKLNFVHFYEHK